MLRSKFLKSMPRRLLTTSNLQFLHHLLHFVSVRKNSMWIQVDPWIRSWHIAHLKMLQCLTESIPAFDSSKWILLGMGFALEHSKQYFLNSGLVSLPKISEKNMGGLWGKLITDRRTELKTDSLSFSSLYFTLP